MTKKIRVLLINPNRFQQPPVIPIGLEYLHHALDNSGFEVSLLDLCFSENPQKEMQKEIEISKPEAVCLTIRNNDSVLYPDTEVFLPAIRELIHTIKKFSKAPVIIGGASLYSDAEAILKFLEADYCITGPAEESLPQLIKELIIEKKQISEKIIKGFINTGPSKIFSLCPPRGKKLDFDKYINNGGLPGFETHKGCSSGCIYCIERSTRVVYRDIPDVIREIKELINMGYDHFHLCDAEFNENILYCVNLLESIVNEKLKFKWALYMKPINYSQKMLELLKKTGAYLITLSVDSFKRSDEYWDDIRNLIMLAKAQGIKVAVDFLTGFPYEKEEQILKHLDFLQGIDPHDVVINTYLRLYKSLPLSDITLGDETLSKFIIGKKNESMLEPVFYNHIKHEWLNRKIAHLKNFRIAGVEQVVNYQKA